MNEWTPWAHWPLGGGRSVFIYLSGPPPTEATIDKIIAYLMLTRDCCPADDRGTGEEAMLHEEGE